LLLFTGNEHQKIATGISFSLRGYLPLVDDTGRILRDDKRGVFNNYKVNILTMFHISDECCLKLTPDFGSIFTGAVGRAEHLCEFSRHVGLQRTHVIQNAQTCLNSV